MVYARWYLYQIPHDCGRPSVDPFPDDAKKLRDRAEDLHDVSEVTFHAIAPADKVCTFGETT